MGWTGKCDNCGEKEDLCNYQDSTVWVYCEDCHEYEGICTMCKFCKCPECRKVK